MPRGRLSSADPAMGTEVSQRPNLGLHRRRERGSALTAAPVEGKYEGLIIPVPPPGLGVVDEVGRPVVARAGSVHDAREGEERDRRGAPS
jgi:hypothetical protein